MEGKFLTQKEYGEAWITFFVFVLPLLARGATGKNAKNCHTRYIGLRLSKKIADNRFQNWTEKIADQSEKPVVSSILTWKWKKKNITSPDVSILSESELHAIKVFSLFDCLVCNLPSAVEEILQNSLTFIRSARWSADCAQVVGSHCKRVSEHEYQCSSCITPITIWLYTSQNHSFQQMRKHECKEIYE